MPIIHAYLLEGRSEELKAEFIRQVTDAAVNSLGAPRESVRIIIVEMPETDFGVAGQTMKQKRAANPPP